MLHKLETFNHRISNWFEWLGIAAMMLMMVITCFDVLGAKIFRWRLLGALDIVMLSQTVAIAFAAGMTQILGRHIQVEFFFKLLPKPFQRLVDGFVHFIGLWLFGVIIWRMCVLGYSFQTSGEYSATVYIPYYPFAYSIAFASIPVFMVFLLAFLASLTQKRKLK